MGDWNIQLVSVMQKISIYFPKKSIFSLIYRFEMMVGIPPFYHNNQMMMFQLIRKAEIRFPAQIVISEEAKDLVKKVTKMIYLFKFMKKT